MSSDILQINLRKSMIAMVELNRHVKHTYVRIGAEGGVDRPGTNFDVDTEGGRSNIRIYHNLDKNVRIGAEGVDGPGGDVDTEGGPSSIRIYHNIDKNQKNIRLGAVVDGDGPGDVDVERERSVRMCCNTGR